MDTSAWTFMGLGWWSFSTAVHWGSAILARRRRPSPVARHHAADFTVVAPLNGAADASPAYIDALVELSQAGVEVLLCVADPHDGAVEPANSQWQAELGVDAPILFGRDDTFNPKMNNVRKGLEAASRPVVALCDAGIALTVHELVAAAAVLSGQVGLVLALKAAGRPDGFAAEMECAYMNAHQARFLLAGDQLGMAVASGGVTLLERDTLQRIGNWRGFSRWIADDYSVVRSVREIGLQTRLSEVMPRLPVGRRAWPSVWRRQVRWARTRLRLPVWPLVLWEPAIGWAVSGLAGAAALVAMEFSALAIGAGIAAHTVSWVAAEAWFMAGRGLSFGWRAMMAVLLREALAPVLMASALSSRRIEWRGADMGKSWRSVGADAARDLGKRG
jgi:ceramide glucosyltransferase